MVAFIDEHREVAGKGGTRGVETLVDPFEGTVLHRVAFRPARADIGQAQREGALSAQASAVMAHGIDLGVAGWTTLPFVEGAHGDEVLEGLARACVGMARKPVAFAIRGEKPVDRWGADGRKAPGKRLGDTQGRLTRQQA